MVSIFLLVLKMSVFDIIRQTASFPGLSSVFGETEKVTAGDSSIYLDQIGQDKRELWSSKLKRLLNLAGLGDIWSAKTNTPAIMSYIRQRLLDIEQQTWISEIHNDERKDPHQKKQTKNF